MKKKVLELIRVLAMVAVLCSSFIWAVPSFAALTADITVTATPSYISIASNQSSYNFGVVSVSTNYSTDKAFALITNGSSVQTDQTIAVTGANWTGGVGWIHSDTATQGVATAALLATKGAAWGTADVIVKNSSALNIATDQAANTNYTFGLMLRSPTQMTDGAEKTNTVRITAAAG